VKPLYSLLPGDSHFKLWFTSGGCNTFLKLFCYVLDQVRKQSALRRGPDQAFLDSVRLGQLGQNVAFVDPNDPTVIYVSQPQETFESVNNHFYLDLEINYN
jgi:WW domain-binding protein 2